MLEYILYALPSFCVLRIGHPAKGLTFTSYIEDRGLKPVCFSSLLQFTTVTASFCL